MPQTCGVQRDQVLQRDRPRILPWRFRGHTLLGFDRGMKPGRPAPVLRDAALELVHHFDGAVLHEVIDVAAQQRMRVQRVLHRGEQSQIPLVEQIAAAERALDAADARIGERDVAPASSTVKCHRIAEVAHHLIRRVRPARRRPLLLPRSPAECEPHRSGWNRPRRSPRRRTAAAPVRRRSKRQPVAQKVEADLVRRGVGDVAGIGARRSAAVIPC